MKWSKQWVAAFLLAPGMYLASCQGSNNNRDTSDSMSTRSAPPSDVNSSTSDQLNSGDTSSSSSNMATGNTNQATTSPGTDASSATTGGSTASGSSTGTTGSTGSSATTSTGSSASIGSTSSTGAKSGTRKTTVARKKKRTTTYGSTSRTGVDRSSTTNRSSIDRTNTTTTPVTSDRSSADQTTTRMDRSSVDSSSSVMNRSSRDTSGGEDMRNMDSSNKMSRGDSSMNTGTDTSAWKNRRDTSWKSGTSGRNSTSESSSTLDSTTGMRLNNSAMVGNNPTGRDTTNPESTSHMGNTSTMTAGTSFTPSSFVKAQIENNFGEIKMARLAIDQGSSLEVKSLARTLENDHNEALRELQTMARNMSDISNSLPTTETDSARQHIDMLRSSRGSDFDKMWAMHMHEMHVKGVQTFENMQTQASDAALKSWIDKMLPKLRSHRDKLAQLDRSLNN